MFAFLGSAFPVERLYDHIQSWLEKAGQGAQIIVEDKTSPAAFEDQIVVRYTRDPATEPFGLIDNETGTTPGAGENLGVMDV